MKKNISNYYILLLLVIMFAAPGVAAYLFYQHPTWLASTKINKGTLLTPPVQLDVIKDHTKWKIIFWSPEVCKQACLKHLDVLARVRLALGRKLYQVDQWLVIDQQHAMLSEQVKNALKQEDFHLAQISSRENNQLTQLLASPRIFIANPDNYLILGYVSGVNPDDVYKDLKLLLNTTETKGG